MGRPNQHSAEEGPRSGSQRCEDLDPGREAQTRGAASGPMESANAAPEPIRNLGGRPTKKRRCDGLPEVEQCKECRNPKSKKKCIRPLDLGAAAERAPLPAPATRRCGSPHRWSPGETRFKSKQDRRKRLPNEIDYLSTKERGVVLAVA